MTDQGIAYLFGIYDNIRLKSFDFSVINLNELNPCARSLKFMKCRSTGVRVQGIRCLMHCASSLQGVRSTAYDALQVPLLLDQLDLQHCHDCD